RNGGYQGSHPWSRRVLINWVGGVDTTVLAAPRLRSLRSLRTATAGGGIDAAFLGLALGRDRDAASEDRNSFLWPSSPDIRDHRAKETPSCHQRRSAKSGPPRRDSARDLDGDGSGLRKCVRSLDDSRLVLAGWKGRWPSAARACGAEIGGFAPHTRYAAVAVNG